MLRRHTNLKWMVRHKAASVVKYGMTSISFTATSWEASAGSLRPPPCSTTPPWYRYRAPTAVPPFRFADSIPKFATLRLCSVAQMFYCYHESSSWRTRALEQWEIGLQKYGVFLIFSFDRVGLVTHARTYEKFPFPKSPLLEWSHLLHFTESR